jgi:hypothetical protein
MALNALGQHIGFQDVIDYGVDSAASPHGENIARYRISGGTFNIADVCEPFFYLDSDQYLGPLAAASQELFTASTTWTVPQGVTSVSVVCVGGGGGAAGTGSNYGGGGGGGGGLAYGTFLTVPGQNYSVVVGQGGLGTNRLTIGNAGGQSSFALSGTVPQLIAGGGNGGQTGTGNNNNGGGAGGTFSTGNPTQGGGTGGRGGGTFNNGAGGGGGGAGGYSGNGGSGAYSNNNSNGTSGSGGGGSGGTVVTSACGGGGGVGIFGEGASGSLPSAGNGGNGGSGGQNGFIGNSVSHGGLYGGGGGADDDDYTGDGGDGANGAVRIIWGVGRAYPSTNTADV